MQNARIVVLGGGYSGLLAAGRLAHKLHNQQVTITLVNAAADFIQRIRLHQLAAQQSPTRVSLSKMLKGTGVNFIQARVSELNPQTHSLTLQTADGKSQALNYDYLVYALGSYVDTIRVPGVEEYALTFGSEAESIRLRDQLRTFAQQAGRLVICGGGLTGIEAATEFAEAYPSLKISLVTRDDFGAQLSAKGRQYLRQVFDRLHIDVVDQANVQEITAKEVRYEGGTLTYDACLWTGAFTVPAFAREAGLKVNALGQISVDDHLCSVSHPDIYAVGDAADVSEAIGTPIRMACATALPMGAYVADELSARLTGAKHRPHEFAYAGRCISLGRHNALFQIVDADDRPKEQILTGRTAALVKELICSYTLWQVQHPRWMYYPRRPASERTVQSTQSVAHTS